MARTKPALVGDPWPTERVRVDRALMRVTAEEVRSKLNLPAEPLAAMDGYAVRFTDLEGARTGHPAVLRLVGSLGPSDRASKKGHLVGLKEALEVATGAPMPAGADVVVKAEDARVTDGQDVNVFREWPRWRNVALAGEDVVKGSVILGRSQIVTPAALALCLACGRTRLAVRKRPAVGVLSVGTELVRFPPAKGGRTRPGTYNNYSNMVRGYLEGRGMIAVDLGICRDSVAEVRSTIERHLDSVDAFLTIAGSSVGKADVVSDAVESITGAEVVFHGLRLVPIRPTGLAVVRREGTPKPVVLLPGHAVSAALATFTVALPIVNILSGQPAEQGRIVVGAAARAVFENSRPLDALYLTRVTLTEEGGYAATPLPWGSNLLGSLSEANGFVRLKAHGMVEASGKIQVELLGPAELGRIHVQRDPR